MAIFLTSPASGTWEQTPCNGSRDRHPARLVHPAFSSRRPIRWSALIWPRPGSSVKTAQRVLARLVGEQNALRSPLRWLQRRGRPTPVGGRRPGPTAPEPGSIPTQRPVTGHDTPTTVPIPRPHRSPTGRPLARPPDPTGVRYRKRLRYNRSALVPGAAAGGIQMGSVRACTGW